MELETSLSLQVLQDAENINELLTEDESATIGKRVLEAYRADVTSRQRWTDQMEEADKLAMQITESKSYPWPNSANVKFPLLTIAAMQFAARAYPALVTAPDLVKYPVQGKDEGWK